MKVKSYLRIGTPCVSVIRVLHLLVGYFIEDKKIFTDGVMSVLTGKSQQLATTQLTHLN